MKEDIIAIMGHTAGGKTSIAAKVALLLNGEIISADSRQVYRGMDIGTGKDYSDYSIEGSNIPYHLIDIIDAGEEYNVFRFQKDFFEVYKQIKSSNKLPVVCGGSGMYIEAILRQYDLLHVPVNMALRDALEKLDLEALVQKLKQYRQVHNQTDTISKKRAIRAIEIAHFMEHNEQSGGAIPDIKSMNFVIAYSRENRRRRITERLEKRLQQGMLDEVRELLNQGVSHEKLAYYGLEYKYLSMHLKGDLSYDEMTKKLETAIHQFAKRQMTYFRGMEKRGIPLIWLQGEAGPEVNIDYIVKRVMSTDQAP